VSVFRVRWRCGCCGLTTDPKLCLVDYPCPAHEHKSGHPRHTRQAREIIPIEGSENVTKEQLDAERGLPRWLSICN
jgi:hypothetical protein